MPKNDLLNWIPHKLNFDENEILCNWLYVGGKKFEEPFFQESISKCKSFEENRKQFSSTSTLDGLIHFSENIDFLSPKAFIFHISRCGSTLLAQSLSEDEQNIVLSEPPIFDEILREIKFIRTEISEDKIDEAIIASLKFIGQKRFGYEKNLFVKLDSWHIFYYKKLRELYPETPFIFSFRQPDQVINSQIKIGGMHTAPGVIQPSLFGFELEEILTWERPKYIAKVLEKYFEKLIEIKGNDNNTLFLDYKNGNMINLGKIESFLGITFEESAKNKMIERNKFHSKNPNTLFEEPFLETEIAQYQQKVFELYENIKA